MHCLIAQTATAAAESMGESLSPWASAGASVVLSGLLIYVMTKFLPSMSERHEATLREIASEHRMTVDKVVVEFRSELNESRAYLKSEADAHRAERETDRVARRDNTERLVAACERIREQCEARSA